MKQKLEWGPNDEKQIRNYNLGWCSNDEKQIRNLDTTKDGIPMMRNQMINNQLNQNLRWYLYDENPNKYRIN